MTTRPAAMRPVQAYASSHNSPVASPQKTPRRVLGELTPNAKLTPKYLQPGAKSPFKTTPLSSPLKAQEALPVSATLSSNENHDSLSSSASRKRPHSAIDSPETPDATRLAIKRQHDMRPQTVSPAVLKSSHIPIDAVVDMADEESSTDEDEAMDMAHSPIVEHMDVPSATQGTTGSFSSLIDYNPNASDNSDPATISTSSKSSEPVTSRVELLKLRLRMAMYKINTNQTTTPFAKLAPPHARTSDVPDVLVEDQDEEDALTNEVLDHQAVLEHEVEACSPKSAPGNIIIKAGPIAKLFDGPVLAPTAYSSRFIEAPNQHLTPVASPARAFDRDEKELTSSAVKGHAASGLLELAHSQ